jgi:hypothetical protein
MRSGLAPLIGSLSVTLSLSGCSFLFVQPPHEGHGYRGVVGCTTTPVAPIVDTIFTLTNVASTAYVASADNLTNRGTAVAVGLAVTALWFSSAMYGYHYTYRCTELQRNDDDDRPYHRPGRSSRLPEPIEPAPIEPAPPAPPREQVTPPAGAPVVPQQSDDDDPPTRRRVPGPPPVAPPYEN